MAIKGWIRVSGDKQDYNNQRHTILEYTNKNQQIISQWFEYVISTRKQELQRFIQKMIASMDPGDILIVSELSRLGRSLREMLNLIHDLHENKKVTIIAIKENITIKHSENMSMQDTIVVTLFALMFQLERDFISLRTKEALAALRAKGKRLGRKKGLGKSRLDGKEDYIKELLHKNVSKSSLAKILDVSRSTLVHFIKTRKLEKKK